MLSRLSRDPQPRRWCAPFSRSLTEHAIACERRCECTDIARLGDIEHVKARAYQKRELVAQDLTGSA